MNTPGYTEIRKKICTFQDTLRYTQDTAKYNLRAKNPKFKSKPPLHSYLTSSLKYRLLGVRPAYSCKQVPDDY